MCGGALDIIIIFVVVVFVVDRVIASIETVILVGRYRGEFAWLLSNDAVLLEMRVGVSMLVRVV